MTEGGGPSVHLNPNVRGLRPSPTVGINERCDRLRREGVRVFKLGLGQSPFPVPSPVVEELQACASRKDYLPVCGLPALREAVADYHRRHHGIPVTAADVLIGPGSKELMFLLQLAYQGELVVPTPAWVSYVPQARILDRSVRLIPTEASGGWLLRPEQLDELCREDPRRPRIVVLNYPGNPTGATYGAAELEELAAIARRFGVVLLSDEIYGELHHRGEHVSIARFYPEGTIVASGLSKWCGAGGWRLGTFAFPPTMRWLLEAMAAVASETYTSTSAPIQYAAVRAFRGGIRIERYLWHARRFLAAIAGELAPRLAAAGGQVHAPAGAFYLFPDFSERRRELATRGIHGSRDLCELLLAETGVAVLPGADFGRPESELTVRLAYVDFDGARALAALETMTPDAPLSSAFVEAHCRDLLEAARRMARWMADGTRP